MKPGIEVLGEFVAATRYEDLGDGEQMLAKMRLLDAIACAVAGRRSEAARLAGRIASSSAPAGPSSLWPATLRGAPEQAVFVNSLLVHGTLLDDGPVHTGCVVVPVALALGEAENQPGREVLTGIAIGYETMLRIDSGGLAHTAMERGFRHSWPVVFGGAATAARLMRLDALSAADALALVAAVCNPGTMEPIGRRGTTERLVQMATNAKMSVFAASLAKTGFRGSRTALEGAAGVYAVHAGKPELPAGLLRELGTVWHLDEMTVKPYPCSGPGTLPTYCAEQVASAHHPEVADIVAVDVRMKDWAPMMEAVSYTGPFTDFEQALVSTCFQIASTLVFGQYDVDVVLQALGDDRVDSIAARTRVTAISGLADDEHEVRVTLRGGSVVATAADMPREMTQPSDWNSMLTRFHRLTKRLPKKRRDRIAAAVWDFDAARDCRSLTALIQAEFER